MFSIDSFMVLAFQFQSDSGAVNEKMSKMVRRQMPFATSLALNTTAKTLVAGNKRDMRRTFSIPVKYMLNAFRFDFVKIRDVKADIAKATNRGKNQKPKHRSHYLEIQEEGGPRPQTGWR